MGPDACASSLIRPFRRLPPFRWRVSGGLVVGRVGGFAWGLWGLPPGGFPLFLLCSSFSVFLFPSFPSLLVVSLLLFFPPSSFSLFLPLFLLVVFRFRGCLPCLGFRFAALPSRPRFALLFSLLQKLG